MKNDGSLQPKKLIILFLITVLVGCTNRNPTAEKTEIHNTDSVDQSRSAENKLLWKYDCMADSIIQLNKVGADRLNPSALTGILNASYVDQVLLEFVKISHDTIYMKIDNSEVLTQQMGTTGALEYLISATFTLTELKNIRYVNFDFEYGDHAEPGTYDRQTFWNWIAANKELNLINR
ncbi:hypothetical protein [Gaoshiqia sp. Z1-71]|uniref:hypothetical protein n=1 Tax=Gaoshiqia hydrogeniformans TaxID=3290090 RepID=UPI003BF8B397